MALDSKIILESIDGIREIRLIDYFKNYNIEHLRKKEVITKLIIPKKNGVSGYYKLGKRNSLAIARISVAVNLILEQDIIKDISIVVGAAGKVPFEVTDVKEDIINEKKEVLFENENLSILENAVYNSIKGRSTVDFKKEAVKGVYKQALYNALKIEGV